MKKLAVALLLALLPSSAFAQATFTFKDAVGATQTVKSFNCSATICPMTTLVDSTGAAIGVTGSPLFANVQGWAGGTLGAMANYGTSPGAVLVPGVNAFVTNQATAAAQASTTSGQTGPLVQCAVTTSSPTYTTAQTDPLSCDTAGNMRVNIVAGLNNNVSLADALANNTTSAPVAGFNLLWNGATWDRAPGTAAGGAKVNVGQVNGVTVLTGTGATGTGAQRVTVSTDQATNAGAALVKGGVGVVNGGSTYQAVAASQTATVLQTSTGATGDYLSHCVLYPTSTSPGVVTVFDNTNAAAGSAILFPGGATSLSNLAPISIPVGAVSTAGAWKVTTGASISVVCYGKFS